MSSALLGGLVRCAVVRTAAHLLQPSHLQRLPSRRQHPCYLGPSITIRPAPYNPGPKPAAQHLLEAAAVKGVVSMGMSLSLSAQVVAAGTCHSEAVVASGLVAVRLRNSRTCVVDMRGEH